MQSWWRGFTFEGSHGKDEVLMVDLEELVEFKWREFDIVICGGEEQINEIGIWGRDVRVLEVDLKLFFCLNLKKDLLKITENPVQTYSALEI